jgi:hypothetical protein
VSTLADAPLAASSRPRLRHLAARAGLALVALAQLEIGVWGIVSPHSLYASYPGAGHHWISALGPYNEHLIRDFAAMELGFGVLLLCAAIWFGRQLVLIAGTAFLAATLPHLAYHLTTTESFSTTDNAASLIGFGVEIAVVTMAMLAARNATEGRQ